MSGVIYNPPDEYLNIFNPINYFYDTGAGISQSAADLRYIKKAGDTATGIINFSNGLATADGTNGTPYGLSFINDTNTGYYRIGADNLGISCGGVKQIDISTTNTIFTNPIQVPDGTAVAPSLNFSSSPNMGLFNNSGALGLTVGGVNKLSLSTTSATFANPILVTNGTATACTYAFVNSGNSGMYLSGTNAVSFSAGGSQMLTFQSAQIYSQRVHNFITGTAADPSIRSTSYATTGCFWKATPSFCITTAGTERVDISQNGSAFSNQIQGKAGAVNDPSFSWVAEQTSGWYRAALNDLRFSVGGVAKWQFTSTANISLQQLNMNSNNIINAPQVGNTAGNLELAVNSTGAGGTITLTGGTDLLQATAGGSAGQHLKLIINGTIYKIALLNN